MSVANKDEALRCLDKARNYLAEGNTDRAKFFAEKAKNLYSCPEVWFGTGSMCILQQPCSVEAVDDGIGKTI